MRYAAFLLALAPTLFGQDGTASVEGQVVNSVTGAPVRRAVVSVRLQRMLSAPNQATVQNSWTAETDEQGRFAIRGLPPAGYGFTAQRQGFLLPGSSQLIGRAANLMVGEGQQVRGVTLRLVPQSVISGKVLDEYGDPVVGITVTAQQPASVGAPQFAGGYAATATTNDLGEYRLAGLAAGSYVVAAGPLREIARTYPDQPRQEITYVRTFHPAAIDAGSAAAIRLSAGAEVRGTDIKLAKTKTVTVSGRTSGTASMTLISRSSGGPGSNSVGFSVAMQAGAFQIAGVPPGKYFLVARQYANYGQPSGGGSLEIEVGDKPLEGLVVPVAPATDVEVVFRSEPPGRCGNSGYVSLRDKTGLGSVQPANPSRENGATLKNVIPSEYTLELPGGSCYVRSVRFAGREASESSVRINGPGQLEITLAAAEAVVSGTVKDAAGKPAPDAAVTFIPAAGASAASRIFVAGRTGMYSASGIPPGSYEAFAWEVMDYQSPRSPEFMRQFAGRGKSVTVSASGSQTVDLTMIPASAIGRSVPEPLFNVANAAIEGRVINAATGAPIAGATVTLGTQPMVRPRPGGNGPAGAIGGAIGNVSQPASPFITAETDAQGRFTLNGVAPDIYYIAAERAGFSSPVRPNNQYYISEQILAGNGQRIAGFTIRLFPESVIQGKVVDEYHEPVNNAQVILFRPEYVGAARRLARFGVTQTDDLGAYRLTGAPAGTYYLAAMKRPLMRAGGRGPALAAGGETDFGFTWYPNVNDPAVATPVLVGASGDVSAEIVMRRAKVVRLRGTVLNESGAPEERPSVALTPRGLGTVTGIGVLSLRPGGEFEFSSVPPGSYMLSARGAAASNGSQPKMAFLPVEVRDSDVAGVTLKLAGPREVRGVLKMAEGGAPSALLSISAAEGLSSSASVTNGVISIPSVWPLTYGVDVRRLCVTCYVKSIRYAGRDAAPEGTDFSVEGELEIVVSSAGASVDGNAPPRATVMIAPAKGVGAILRTSADSAGAFHFESLAPGDYLFYAFTDSSPDPLPEALAPFRSRALSVALPPGRAQKVIVPGIGR